MDDATDLADPLAQLAREHLLKKRREARKKKKGKDAARSAAAASVKVAQEPTLCDKLRAYRAEVDDAAAAEEAFEHAKSLKPPTSSPELLEQMRHWIRRNGAHCFCVPVVQPSPAGRPREQPSGCKLHWRYIFTDHPILPHPHNFSLLSRFCFEHNLKKKRWFFPLFQEALVLERFALPANATERNMVLSNRTRVDHVGGFVHGWMDVTWSGGRVDTAPPFVENAERPVVTVRNKPLRYCPAVRAHVPVSNANTRCAEILATAKGHEIGAPLGA